MENKLNFNDKLNKIIENKDTNIEELKSIESSLRENLNLSVKNFHNYFFASIILIVIWFLVNNSILDNVEVFNMKINNTKVLLISIPFISSITNYLMISYLASYQMIDIVIKKIETRIYPSICGSALIEFVSYPSFIEIESMKVRLSNESLMSGLSLIFISLILMATPFVCNFYIIYKLIDFSVFSWYTILPLIYALINLKSLKNLIFYIKQMI